MKQKIIKFFVYFGIIVGSFTLQTAVFHFFPLADITPNIMLITVMAIGLMRGRKTGMIVGFFSGLLLDVFFGGYLGIYALIYMAIGYVNGFFNHLFYAEEVVLPIAMIALNDFIYGWIIYFLFYFMRSKWDFLFYFRRIILPETVYTLFVGMVLYFVLLWIDGKLRMYEKRSA